MINKISFENGEQYISTYGFYKKGEFTPIYMIKNNNKYFLINLIKVIEGGDGYDKNDYERSKEKIEQLKNQLIKNNGKYATFHAKFDNPFDLINWVKENNYSFEIHGELFYECEGFTDFHGNVKEYSCAFQYRIYDKDILQQLKDEVSKCKTHVFFLRNH